MLRARITPWIPSILAPVLVARPIKNTYQYLQELHLGHPHLCAWDGDIIVVLI